MYTFLDGMRRVANKLRVPAFLNKIGVLRQVYRTYWITATRLSNTDIVEREISKNSGKFKVNDWKDLRHLHGEFETEEIELILSQVESDDVFYDIGAHIGIYTCLLAKRLNEGEVVAFEPNLEMRERLKANVSLNNLKNVTVVPYAVSNHNTNGKITGWSISSGRDSEGTDIDIVSGDSIIERDGLAPPDAVKIDIEGEELAAIKGLKETLKETCSVIHTEIHPDRLDEGNEEQIEKHLLEFGFELERVGETQGLIYHLSGIK